MRRLNPSWGGMVFGTRASGIVVPDDLKSVSSEFLVRFSDLKKDLDAKGLTSS
jgi:hypothetical protein